MADLRAADVIFVATHSQGSVVSTHLLDRLIRDGHVRTPRPPTDAVTSATEAAASSLVGAVIHGEPQRICCVALCGIHMGPLRYLNSSSMIKPYFQVCRTLVCYMDVSLTPSYSILSLLRRWSCSSSRCVMRVYLAYPAV